MSPDNSPMPTVGSLLGLPLGSTESVSAPAEAAATLVSTSAPTNPPPLGAQEAPGWTVADGQLSQGPGGGAFRPDGVEALTYDNPFGQSVERAWFDGKIVFAIDVGEIDVDERRVKVAQEYQIVHRVELDEQGKLRGTPDVVAGQLNIYDSVPGMPKYSPIWQFNYVVVPADYEPNTLRSAADCEASGYPIVRSRVFEN